MTNEECAQSLIVFSRKLDRTTDRVVDACNSLAEAMAEDNADPFFADELRTAFNLWGRFLEGKDSSWDQLNAGLKDYLARHPAMKVR